MARVIGHVDLDYFYAQVEEVLNPSLKGRPVAVCVFSGRTTDSGVVSTANYVARALGVSSGMPIVTAKKRLEGHDPAIIRMDHEKYEAVSERVMAIVAEHVDAFEPTGIDEAFFDLTESSQCDFDAATTAAQTMKGAILEAEKLTSSVGLGRSKAVAKLASDSAKPSGLVTVMPEFTQAFLDPIPVIRLYGVGPKTATTLAEISVKTIGELSRSDASLLEERFGRKLASYLFAAANGNDADVVAPGQGPTQFSRIVTLRRDTRDPEEALGQLAQGLASVKERLAGSGKSFRTISTIGILTDLSTKTKSKSFDAPVSDADLISRYAPALLQELVESTDKDLRRVGVRVSELNDAADQTSLSEYTERGT